MKHRLSAMALALSMGLSLTNGVFATEDFQILGEEKNAENGNEFELVTYGIESSQGNAKEITDEKLIVPDSNLFTEDVFKDDYLRYYLISKYGNPENSGSKVDKLSDITELNLINTEENQDTIVANIKSLEGIDKLTGLTTLVCNGMESLESIVFLP